ncbi:Putative odorant-binding protein A10 [Camponotus floridanus]|uniref:Putative odorant-binding protein A10 n=1 Tax=Camponotus floridanus TaxID=104421 RepID=E2APN3_CAMFO|nr:ejaculatory bulb-specific protein 3 [Camponotus floridanus]EFN64584.1 Putative odorant-binding protein A10 [Camponotus floridanus]
MTRLASCTFACLVATLAVLIAHAENEKYSSKYDHIDVNEVLANSHLRNQYVRCLINISPCTMGSARFLKDIFAEAFITKCKKCTDKQIYIFNVITDWFTKNEPETWNHIVRTTIEEAQRKNA